MQEREDKSPMQEDVESSIRPLSFADFTGQNKVMENLHVFVEAAKLRGEPLDHVLFHGPPGLGKTTLAHILANELGVPLRMTSGPVMIQVLEGENAVVKNRELMGATNPKEAAAGTIRADFAESIDANAVHGSDSLENAAIEIAYFFAATELCPR